mmetsp:Transcript_12485/g.14563  ORF Transcript_12485/g.14563 Transcript_12485/m.14563 type:complete len:381 (+) Transcript_12485:107-1249(+)|eukprot:CAMPEP_0184022374 /NCGR_PEP_ID=MMETSP0954-20121128/10568_2 /TAXON_ID=627963 /ORGANISM="Aplanochytrium sp, Strain PBS07" /LENGTH=380 /DNA_ID=CAMNT_0026304737 /DNA_START=45 /DNA_END=1187 /DNA_ORIENTATION=-
MKCLWKLLARGGLPKPLGPNEVAVLPFRFPESAYAHIFYPVSPDSKKKYPKGQYTRQEAAEGLAQYLKVSPWKIDMLLDINHPFVREAPIRGNSATDNTEKLPVVIFSHGLGGSAEMYSKFCGDVASHGFIVIAVEHEDHSGSYFQNAEGEVGYYKVPPSDLVYNVRENVIQFRKPFLEKRRKEVLKIMSCLDNGFGMDDSSLSKLEMQILGAMDTKNIFLAGHSFGGCSTAFVMHSLEKEDELAKYAELVKGCIVLDIWSYPLPEEILKGGVRTPIVSILSEQFATNNEINFTTGFLNSSNCAHSSYIAGTVHQQFSDTPWFSSLKFFKLRTELEGETHRDISQNAIMEIVKMFLQDPGGNKLMNSSNWEDLPILQPVK